MKNAPTRGSRTVQVDGVGERLVPLPRQPIEERLQLAVAGVTQHDVENCGGVDVLDPLTASGGIDGNPERQAVGLVVVFGRRARLAMIL